MFTVAILVILCVPSALFAQETLSETFVSEDGSFTFAYPDGWDAVEQEAGKVILTNADVTITFYGPSFVDQVLSEIDTADLEATLNSFLEAGGMPAQNMTSLEIGDSTVAQAEIESAVGTGAAFGLAFDSDTMGVVTAVMPTAMFEDFAPTLIDIVDSFGPAEEGASDTGAALANALQSAAEARTNVNCTVRVEEERSASVRVGPGTNRTAMLFLPANHDYKVQGQAEANDGAMWWKLDKDEVAPNSAAAELWVDQNQVIASEDCSQVPNVEPPPIIPIVAVTDTLPTSGTWTFNAPSMRVDCQGLGTFSVSTDIPPFQTTVIVSDNGSALLLEGNRLNRTQPGTYVGRFYEPSLGGSLTFTIRVIASDHMEGEVSGSSEGCNVVMGVSLTH
jgi:hypothetical protein